MTEVTIVGLDLAKRVFQVHGSLRALRSSDNSKIRSGLRSREVQIAD